MTKTDNKYFAFISYNSKDIAWGRKLQRKLEHYRMPATLCSEKGWKGTPIRPVFFAPTDIQPGGLTKELQDRLGASRNLVVICSPNSARSEWVGKEIAFFHELGRTKNIHFFIVDGIPHSGDPETECFNPIVDKLGLPELLGANIHEKTYRWSWLNKERAYVQLISKLLEVEFDSIWKRHRRQLVQKIVAWTICFLTACLSIVGVWAHSKPVDVQIRLNETSYHNDNLPALKDAIVTMELSNEVKTDTIKSLDAPLIFSNIPQKFINEKARIIVRANDYFDVDTTLNLRNEMNIDMCRDSLIYGNIRFRLWDQEQETYVKGVDMEIAGQKVRSDENGQVQLYVPLQQQNTCYNIISDIPLENDILYMPCGKDVVVLIK